MPFYDAEGFGRDTGRKRKRTYKAKNSEDAIICAGEDGTVVDPATLRRVFPLRHFFSKIVGVTHQNGDGSDRQQLIRRCRPGCMLGLSRERANRYSENAVAVLRESGEQLGYLPDETAAEIVEALEDGWVFVAYISEITGGDPRAGKPTLGANLLIVGAADGDTPEEQLHQYVHRILVE